MRLVIVSAPPATPGARWCVTVYAYGESFVRARRFTRVAALNAIRHTAKDRIASAQRSGDDHGAKFWGAVWSEVVEAMRGN